MKTNFTFFVLMGFLILASGCNDSDTGDIDVDQKILVALESEQIPSVVACVVKGDEIVWEGTYGYANQANSEPASRNSLYTIMSIGKLVLATAVYQLWEEDRINLDADINQYLPFEVRNPFFPNEKITPHMLLNHTSGLAWPEDPDRIPDFHHFYSAGEPPLISEWLPQYILPGGQQYREAVWKNFKPGEVFLYSNIGTSLLGLIVEQIAGVDYRDYCQTNILDPLEMHNSAYRLDRLDEAMMVTPYNDNGFPMNYYTCRHYPAGFLSCNLEDFSHYVIAMLNYGEYKGNRILEASTVKRLLELQDPSSGTANLWVHCLGDCVGHRGGGTGFSTWAEWHFENDRAMFIFSNKVNDSVYPLGRLYELVKYQSFQY